LIQRHLTNTRETNFAHPATAEGKSQELSANSFFGLWRWWLPPALIGLCLVLYYVDPFIGDWDGIDYTMLSLAGYPSSMALGRNLFIFGNHFLFVLSHTLFDVKPENAYLIFKYAVVVQSPLAILACWWLAFKLTRAIYTATIAALLIAFSPVFVIYGGQVMTDVPSVLLLAVALILHLHGLQSRRLSFILLGAALLGLGVNLRETVGFYATWLVLGPVACGWQLRRREFIIVFASCIVFFVFASAWFAYWFLVDPHYRWIWHGWRESMRQESARHPVTLANLPLYFFFLFVSAPLVFITLPLVPVFEARRKKFSPVLALWLTAIFADALLFLNYSTIVNWRYFLTGLPGLVPLSSYWMVQLGQQILGSTRRAFVACLIVVVGLALTFAIYMRPVSFEFIERRAMSKDYKSRLAQVPPDSVMISGSQTIAVTYWAAIGLGKWETIGTGGGWPGDRLFAVIDSYLKQGKRVYLDSDSRWWVACGWQRDEIPLIVELEHHFKFKQVTETIYEVRPLNDPTANDKPNLKRLLPENRPEDTKKCPPGRT
jgi:hypothetical protein